jgi:ribosomal protein S18 acetylase RimI-like enzyme
MNISAATERDIEEIVAVHRDAFPDFFLTSLGERFLRRFYSAVGSDASALSFVGYVDGRIAGFVVGTLQPSQFFRKLLLRQGMRFCIDALGALLRRPWFVGRRLLRGLTYRGEAPELRGNSALVSSVAVLPSASGRGLATALLNAFCEAAARRGATSVYLLTDRDDNPAANRFYLKAGFILDTELTRSGKRPMNRYIRDLHGARPDERKPETHE